MQFTHSFVIHEIPHKHSAGDKRSFIDWTMISNFFVLSPRGDTILAKQYRQQKGVGDALSGVKEQGAHERSHTEALFRKIKFWNDVATPTTATTTSLFSETADTNNVASSEAALLENGGASSSSTTSDADGEKSAAALVASSAGDAPPVLLMPDGLTYFHVKRNGLIFGASSARNVSPNTVIEVRPFRFR